MRRFEYAAFGAGEVMRWLSRTTTPILFLAAPDTHIEADHAVLIARAHNRNAPVDEILAFNNLFRALRDVGAVGESKVVCELLLDRDLRPARRGVGFGGQSLRIDLDPAYPKQLLHPAADRGIDGLIDDEIGGLIGKQGLTRLLLQLFGFPRGMAQRQQRND